MYCYLKTGAKVDDLLTARKVNYSQKLGVLSDYLKLPDKRDSS